MLSPRHPTSIRLSKETKKRLEKVAGRMRHDTVAALIVRILETWLDEHDRIRKREPREDDQPLPVYPKE
jgi:predicted DNA-binding protein